MDGKTGFFQEKPGVNSMTRLVTFLAALCAVFLTVYSGLNMLCEGCGIDWDVSLYVFGMWMMALAGKHAGKYLEQMKDIKKQ